MTAEMSEHPSPIDLTQLRYAADIHVKECPHCSQGRVCALGVRLATAWEAAHGEVS